MSEDPGWAIVPSTRCWEWDLRRDRDGYGRIGKEMAHRYIYELLVGPIPEGMTIDHLCFNPPCVNPDHLRPLSRSANCRRQRSAEKTHCHNGHEFTPENTYAIPPRPGFGARQCRACNREAVARYKQRKAS